MHKRVNWLAAEIEKWIQEGIIDSLQGKAIKNRYSDNAQSTSWSRIIFTSIGAILIGLGIILLFAYNWDKMHRFAKLSVIFSFLITAHLLGLMLRRQGNRFFVTGEGFHILGTMVFGAGIWLIAQIYHIDEHFPNAFFIWSIGALSLGWLLPSVPQGIIASVLLVSWNGLEVFSFDNPNHSAPLIILAGIIPLSVILRSRALMGTGVVSFLFALCFTVSQVEADLVVPVLFFSSSILIAFGIIMGGSKNFPQSASTLSFFGWLPYLALLYILSFRGIVNDLIDIKFSSIVSTIYFSATALSAIIVWVKTLWPLNRIREKIAHDFRMEHLLVPAALVILIVLSSLIPLKGWEGAMFFNLLFLAHCVLIILHGCRTVNLRMTTAGSMMFSLLALSRYVDLFESLLMRSLVFVLVGTGLFVIGSFFTKVKRELKGKYP